MKPKYFNNAKEKKKKKNYVSLNTTGSCICLLKILRFVYSVPFNFSVNDLSVFKFDYRSCFSVPDALCIEKINNKKSKKKSYLPKLIFWVCTTLPPPPAPPPKHIFLFGQKNFQRKVCNFQDNISLLSSILQVSTNTDISCFLKIIGRSDKKKTSLNEDSCQYSVLI